MSLQALAAFFAPTKDTPDRIRLAEEPGFSAAWVYDSPLLYHDPYTRPARAADRTSTIALGVGVVASGRVRLALGAGSTGRFTFGLPPVSLRRLEHEVHNVWALLAADEAIHAEGGKPVRLIPVPGAEGDARIPLYIAIAAVADEGEAPDSPRLTEAVGPVVAVASHMFAEQPSRLEASIRSFAPRRRPTSSG